MKKQEAALLLTLFVFAFIFDFNKDMPISFYPLAPFCGFLSVVDRGAKFKAFWALLSWFVIYYCVVYLFGPYSKPVLGWIIRTSCLMFLFLWSMLIKWDRKSILVVAASYSSYLLVWGFLEKIIYNPLRIGGPVNMPTEYAVALSILWGIWFVDFCRQKKNILTLVFPTILVLIAIILSGTRTGMIGLCIGALFGIFAYTFKDEQISSLNKSVKFFIILSSVFILFAIFWNVFMKDLFIAKAMESVLHGKIDNSNKGRIVAWTAAYDAFSNNKIWGVGPDTFSTFYAQFIKNFPGIGIGRTLPHAHNEILQILSETGLLGFLHVSAIVAFCLFSIVNYMRKNKDETICYGLITAFSIFFVTMLVNGTPHFGLIPMIMGIMASFYFNREEEICLQK
ncbi:MAG: O-antigen ligase family protein [Fibromonadaceae bacterium]|nr:O-antigen ligase family protein [Fibromonadaceae bacterium]